MEFNIQRNLLLAGIQKTLGIVEKKTTMPILNNVLIRAEGGKITIIATDREITLVANYNADILSNGDVTVSAKKLYEMIREMPESLIHVIKNEANVLTVSCQKVVYKINGMAADEFPSVADDGGGGLQLFVIDGKVLDVLIVKTFFAIGTDETRRNLTGGLFELDAEGGPLLRMVGTDGHRMAISEVSVEGGGEDFLRLDKGVIIPRKGLAEIRKLVEENAGSVSLGIYGGMCVVMIPDVVLKVSLIDADFPDYRRVIPKDKGVSVKIDKDRILHALKRVNVVSGEAYGGVIVNLKDNIMILKSNDFSIGEAIDEIDVSYNGDEMTVGYNIGYLLNAVDVVTEKDVVMEIGDEIKPTVVKGDGNNRYMSIVMPLKI
ncbi:MAG: DNA polymerase III subunit beta [Syntrophales bacterium]|nr:DNA polymerase III subunit beta [Syntrophales bacterium]